jgi:YD repeat-containing protein
MTTNGKKNFFTRFALVYTIAVGVCQCAETRSRGRAHLFPDGGVTFVDSGRREAGNYLPLRGIPSDRIVTPDEVSIETLEDYIDQPIIQADLQRLQLDMCGYAMSITDGTEDYSSGELIDTEVRVFDEEGRLRLQKSDRLETELETEIVYEPEGRPATMWIKEWADGQVMSAAIIAVAYNEDGSAFSKIISTNLYDCQSLVLDVGGRLVEYIRNVDCDDEIVSKLEMTYREDGKPLSYNRTISDGTRYQDFPGTEIVWDYIEGGRQVIANWDDLEYGKTTLYFEFDPSEKLISIRIDYENDGEIDETTEIEYGEKGKMIRTATDLDRDGISDLLRLNTYDESGLLLTEELHNLGVDGQIVVTGGDFRNVTTSTARVTTYTYDSESRLIERTIENSALYYYFENQSESYRYDDLGRLVEIQIVGDRYNQEAGEKKSLYKTYHRACRFDFACDTTIPDQTSELYRCEFNTPVYQYLFPYDATRRIPFHNNRLSVGGDIIVSVEPEDVLGVPWY